MRACARRAPNRSLPEMKTPMTRRGADLLRAEPDPSPQRIREALAGNLCRCTGYQNIITAVRLAADRMR